MRKPMKNIIKVLMFVLIPGTLVVFAQDPFVALNPYSGDEGSSNGVGWADYDGDGYQDIYVCNGSDFTGQKNFLYRNKGDGTFEKITTGNIANDNLISGSCSWGDFDNDGDLDLYVSSLQNILGAGKENPLYENQGDGTFVKNTTAGPPVSDAENSAAVGWGDYNSDGWLDLFVTNGYTGSIENTLYSSDGDKTFTSVTGIDLVSSANATGIAGFAWADYDNDGDLDLFTASSGGDDAAKNFLWRNDGNDMFTKLAIFDAGDSQACSWGDYDNDGDLDLYITNYGETEDTQEKNFLYRNDGGDTFTKMTPIEVGAIVDDSLISRGSAWGDIDNDGDLDMFVATPGEPSDFYKNCLYINDGDGFFTKDTTSVIRNSAWGFGTAMADFNNDGFLDIFLCRSFDNVLYKNVEISNGNTNHWLIVNLEGTTSNKACIGAKVRAKATINSQEVWQMREVSGQTGYGSQNSLRVHFGFGDATTVTELKIEFPSGKTVTKTNVATNQILDVSEAEAPIAITLASFDARYTPSGAVLLQWQTMSEINTAGFYVQRSTARTGKYYRLNSKLIESRGNPTSGSFYVYEDETVTQPGQYYYRLEEITLDGSSSTTEPVSASIASGVEEGRTNPMSFYLAQNYPNPFNPGTSIDYELPIQANVRLAIYDVRGAVVRSLVNQVQAAGVYGIRWDGRNQEGERVGSGVYMLRLDAGDVVLTRKMLLAK